MIVFATIQLGALLVVVSLQKAETPFGKSISKLGIPVLPLVTSLVWGCAARFWWKGRWWWATGFTLLGYLAGVLCVWLFGV